MSRVDPDSITLKDPERTSHLLLFEYQTITFWSFWKQRIDSRNRNHGSSCTRVGTRDVMPASHSGALKVFSFFLSFNW